MSIEIFVPADNEMGLCNKGRRTTHTTIEVISFVIIQIYIKMTLPLGMQVIAMLTYLCTLQRHMCIFTMFLSLGTMLLLTTIGKYNQNVKAANFNVFHQQ